MQTTTRQESRNERRRARPRSGWSRGLAALLTLIAAVWLITLLLASYVGWSLTHPAERPLEASPAQYHLAWRNIQFPSRKDHLELPGWLIPAAGSDRVIIEAHGYKGNRAFPHPMLPAAQALHQAGFNVLTFDFRGSGTSPKAAVTVGLDEQQDLEGAIDYAESMGYHNIGLLGYSMGASTALEVASQDRRVEATIADSPFASLDHYLRSHLSIWSHLPNWPFTGEILWSTRTFEHLDPRKVNPLDDLEHAHPFPLLLIAGTADQTIPPRNSRELYAAVRNWPHTALWMVPGAKHVGAWKVAPGAYTQRIVGFYQQFVP